MRIKYMPVENLSFNYLDKSSKEEIQEEIFEHIELLIDYWERDSRTPKIRDKLSGLAFSIFVMIDGESMLPSFKLIPSMHRDQIDIAGDLHEKWIQRKGGAE